MEADDMAQKSLDLVQLFGQVTEALRQNEDALNQGDEYNHDHGTNMVQTFQIITGALEQKVGATNSDALYYAADQLKRKGTSGSARLYAANLEQAAAEARGTGLSAAAGLELLQTLMGGEQERQAEQEAKTAQEATAAQAAVPTRGLGGLLGSLIGAVQSQQQVQQPVQQSGGLDDLLGGLLGGQQQVQQPAQQSSGLSGLLGGLFGSQQQVQQPVQQTGGGLTSLLGSLMGGQQQVQQQSSGTGGVLGLISSLMGGGQASGSSAGLGALVQAFTGGSSTAQNYRKDSSTVVISTVLKAIMGLMGK